MFKSERVLSVLTLLIFFAIGLIVLPWFAEDKLIIAVDTILPLDSDFYREYTSIWPQKASYVGPDVYKFPILFIYIPFIYTLDNLTHLITGYTHFDTRFFEIFLVYLLYVTSGFSTYLLSKQFFKKLPYEMRLISGIVYMFNFYVMFLLVPLPLYLMFSYMLFPLAFTLYAKALSGQNSFVKGIGTGMLCFFILVTSYGTPPYILLHTFVWLTYTGFLIINRKHLENRIYKTLAGFFITFLLFNMFWLIPLYITPKPPIEEMRIGNTPAENIYYMNSSPLIQTLTFQGYFGLRDEYKGYSFYPWYKTYETPVFILLSFVLPVLSYYGLLKIKQWNYDDKHYLYLSLLSLFFIFLVSFQITPFSTTITQILRNTAYFDVFRTAYQRFTGFIALTFSLMVPYSYFHLIQRWKRNPWVYKGLVILFVILNIALSYPIVTGALFTKGPVTPSKKVRFPSSFTELASYIRESSADGYYSLTVPFNRMGLTSLSWNEGNDGYDGVYPLTHYSIKGLLYMGGDYLNLVEEILDTPGSSFGIFGRALNVKRIIFLKDTNWRLVQNNYYYAGRNPVEIEERLNTDPCLFVSKEIGNAVVYEMKDSCLGNKIVTVSESDLIYTLGGSSLYKERSLLELTYPQGLTLVTTDASSAAQLDGKPIILTPQKVNNFFKSDAYWSMGWIWPKAPTSPDSSSYTLIRNSENLKLISKKNNYFEYLDYLTMLTSQRIAEIETWDPSCTKVIDIQNELIQNLGTIQEYYNTVPLQSRDGNYYSSLNKTILYLNTGLNMLIRKDSGSSRAEYLMRKCQNLAYRPSTTINQPVAKTDHMLSTLNSTISYLKRLWPITGETCKDLCYYVYIPKEDQYSIKLLKGPPDNSKNYELYLNGVLVKDKENIKFLRGGNLLSITFPKNLPSENAKSYVKESLPMEGLNSDIISFDNINPNKNHILSFKYRIKSTDLQVNLKGHKVDYMKYPDHSSLLRALNTKNIEDKSLTQKNLIDYKLREVVTNPQEWNYFQMEFNTDSDFLTSLDLNLNIFPTNQNSSYNVELSDIEVSEVIDPNPVLIHKDISTTTKAPTVNYKQISPYAYEINLQDPAQHPFYLIFRNSLDSGWKLYEGESIYRSNLLSYLNKFGASLLGNSSFNNIGLSPINSQQVPADYYSSMWKIEPSSLKSNRIYLYYYPQNYLHVSTALAVLTVTAFVSTAIILKLINSRRR